MSDFDYIPDYDGDSVYSSGRKAGRPRSGKAMTSAERKRRWRDRHPTKALEKAREYQRAYRQRKSKKFNYEKEEK